MISAPLDAALRLEVFCDGESVAVFDPVNQHEFSHTFADSVDQLEHVIEFAMSNKTFDHTTVDQQGNIVSDSLIFIKNKQLKTLMLTMRLTVTACISMTSMAQRSL